MESIKVFFSRKKESKRRDFLLSKLKKLLHQSPPPFPPSLLPFPPAPPPFRQAEGRRRRESLWILRGVKGAEKPAAAGKTAVDGGGRRGNGGEVKRGRERAWPA